MENELAAYQPTEAIINISSSECGESCAFLKDRFNALISDSQKRLFDYESARDSVKRVFSEESDKLSEPEMIMSVGALLRYIKETQKSDVTFVKEINVYSKGQYLDIDINTRRNLELTESMRTKEKRGSLLWVLDRTETAMGARVLRSWILKPLLNPALISRRQAAISDFVRDGMTRSELSALLSGILDLERLTAKAVYGTANAKDLRAIYQSIYRLPEIKAMISKLPSDSIKEIALNGGDISSFVPKNIAEAIQKKVQDGTL